MMLISDKSQYTTVYHYFIAIFGVNYDFSPMNLLQVLFKIHLSICMHLHRKFCKGTKLNHTYL